MATEKHRESATIYAFPARDRPGAGGLVVKQMSAEEFASKRVVPTDFGGGWYHDAAIRDDRD